MKPNLWAAATALAICSSVVGAQETATIPLLLTAGPGGTLSTTFLRPVTGLFVDTFSFTPQSVDGTITVSLVPGLSDGPVSFFAALLNEQEFSFLPESGQSTFNFQATVTSSMPLSLTVFGFSGNLDTLVENAGSYSGTISVVPEPAGYALMALGLAAVGGLARRAKAFA